MPETLVLGSRGPRSRRPRRACAAAAFALVCLVTMNAAGPERTCPAAPETTPRTLAGATDADVRDLQLGVLDRARRTGDAPPAGLMPADLRETTRRVLTTEAIDVYVAGGVGFACLAARPKNPAYDGSSVCRLDLTIANSGLTTEVVPTGDGPGDRYLVAVVPDGWTASTRAAPDRVTRFPNGALVRRGDESAAVVLTSPAGRTVAVRSQVDVVGPVGTPCS